MPRCRGSELQAHGEGSHLGTCCGCKPVWRAVLEQAGDTAGRHSVGILWVLGTAVPSLYCNAVSKWPQRLRVPAGQGSSLNGSLPQAASPTVWQTLPLSRILVKGREVTRGLETWRGGVRSCVGAWGWAWGIARSWHVMGVNRLSIVGKNELLLFPI